MDADPSPKRRQTDKDRQHAQAHRRDLQTDVDVKRRINDTATMKHQRPKNATRDEEAAKEVSDTPLLNAALITSNTAARRAAYPRRHGDPVLNHKVPPA